MEAGNCLNRGLARITQMTRIRGTGGNEGFPYYEQEGKSQKSGIGVPSYQEGLSYLNDLGCCVVLSEFGEVVSAECEFQKEGCVCFFFE